MVEALGLKPCENAAHTLLLMPKKRCGHNSSGFKKSVEMVKEDLKLSDILNHKSL